MHTGAKQTGKSSKMVATPVQLQPTGANTPSRSKTAKNFIEKKKEDPIVVITKKYQDIAHDLQKRKDRK